MTLFMMRQMGNGTGTWACLERYGFPLGTGFPASVHTTHYP
jgi:hypothetical protein